MKIYQGKSVFNGIAVGRICVYRKDAKQVKRYKVDEPERELERFYDARNKAMIQLAQLHEKALREVGEANAAIFEMHQIMLQDEGYLDSIENVIRVQAVNAEYAVAVTSDNFSAMLASMEDDYIKERAADVRDISERVLSILSGEEKLDFGMEEPVILAADDLAPSETVQLDKDKILAFVTVHGSLNSHTAILARTMGIPALIGTGIPLDDTVDGKTAVVDGNQGCLYIEPDAVTMGTMQEKLRREKDKKELLLTLKGKDSVTLDGKKIRTYANIGDIKDLALVLQNDAEGIGLFRSEFLYLEKDTYPTEEEQFRVYKTVAETMAGKYVIIRTLDIGADKKADYFNLPAEENPAMGCRAIRICLTRPEIFKTQLRAIYRASAYGKLAIMYPMITSVSEIRQIKAIRAEVKAELEKEQLAFGEVEEGIMIETPAAAVISDLLAEEVDFFSIGTNDLTQYLLAIDRQNEALDAFYDAWHPAVLRMIHQTIQNAHKAGIWCGICGELGADTRLTKLFLAMGVDELSVSPGNVLPVRRVIRETDVAMESAQILKDWL